MQQRPSIVCTGFGEAEHCSMTLLLSLFHTAILLQVRSSGTVTETFSSMASLAALSGVRQETVMGRAEVNEEGTDTTTFVSALDRQNKTSTSNNTECLYTMEWVMHYARIIFQSSVNPSLYLSFTITITPLNHSWWFTVFILYSSLTVITRLNNYVSYRVILMKIQFTNKLTGELYPCDLDNQANAEPPYLEIIDHYNNTWVLTMSMCNAFGFIYKSGSRMYIRIYTQYIQRKSCN